MQSYSTSIFFPKHRTIQLTSLTDGAIQFFKMSDYYNDDRAFVRLNKSGKELLPAPFIKYNLQAEEIHRQVIYH